MKIPTILLFSNLVLCADGFVHLLDGRLSPPKAVRSVVNKHQLKIDLRRKNRLIFKSSLNDGNSREKEGTEKSTKDQQYIIRAPSVSKSSTKRFFNQEELYAREDIEAAERQSKIQEIVEEDDRKWKEKRLKEKLGKFADAQSAEDWKRLVEEESNRIRQENNEKVEIAQKSGVSFTLLENTDSNNNSQDISKQFNVKGKTDNSWFKKIDSEINAELERINFNDLSLDENMDEARFVDGKFVSQDKEMGVRVGSAGGWSLEVFPGDFVVHRKYGIGRFDQTVVKPKKNLSEEEEEAQKNQRSIILKKLLATGENRTEIQEVWNQFGTEADVDPISNPQQTVLEVTYSDGKVHIPVDKAYRLSRFRAGDAAVKPRLSRLKGGAWARAKRKVEEGTVEMAQQVLALYAKRESTSRSPFDPAKEVLVNKFESTFPYDPTSDQQKCFENVENDMVWRNRPMDRLVCGDVGFGKTEVALRALFRCVANGRQCALLAPTGVLAAQHMKSVLDRMGPDTHFNVRIALLRGGMGKNTKIGRSIREQIKSGQIDLVVGTHALLSSGIGFKDFGLLVVDEEQRFGVKQKERLKVLFGGIDVLTLTATPIPRTLQMSLSGIRDTSTIRSPPPMRKAIMTFVLEFDEVLIRDGIQRELDRGGQCFFVVPRISQLGEAETVIKKLFPEIRTIQAHGQMPRGQTEENVAAFAEGKHDILLATTVIENGVDIPTVNTIIVQNAQSFGMSTLYQLRGRVGRSNLQAYAYFLHKAEAITEQSAMRLQAMNDLRELGSGFDVANRDLEIRGAGSLLGTEQSGMAAKVGFDLYMRMLKKAIRQLRGIDLPMVLRTNVLLPNGEGSLEIAEVGNEVTHAFAIPKSYIEDDNQRMKQEGIARLAENTKQLVTLTNAWKNEYGPLSSFLQSKLKTLHLHACTRTLGIDLVVPEEKSDDGFDCILRCPGLRPWHWVQICRLLPKGIPTKGIDAVFPSRFSKGQDETIIVGGEKMNVNDLVLEQNASDEEEGWDNLDEEEVESMKEIKSAAFVKSLDDIDIKEYPRFVVRNLSIVNHGSRVDALLKILLPASKVVYEAQQADKEKAKVAAELKEKTDAMKKQKKEGEALMNKRLGYRY